MSVYEVIGSIRSQELSEQLPGRLVECSGVDTRKNLRQVCLPTSVAPSLCHGSRARLYRYPGAAEDS